VRRREVIPRVLRVLDRVSATLTSAPYSGRASRTLDDVDALRAELRALRSRARARR
jgi:hypothetical protein